MSTIPATTAAVAAAYTRPTFTPSLAPSRQIGLDFASLLAAQGTPATDTASDTGLSALSSLNGDASGGLEGLLTYAVLRLIERLLNGAGSTTVDQAAPAAGSLPVVGTLSQDYHAGHHGLDIAVPLGTPVHSTQSGRVIHAGWNDEGYGNLVIVENGAYRTYYAHLEDIDVQVGDQLASGAVVGLSGSTGNSTGPHVHYEVRLNGTTVNPTQAPDL